MEAVKIGLIF